MSHFIADKPKIHFLRKLKRSPITLRCEADGNPSPTFYWHKDSEIIHEGFNSSWNASTLTVSPVNDKDSTRYVCTAKNKIGWDALAFQLHKKGKCSQQTIFLAVQCNAVASKLKSSLTVISNDFIIIRNRKTQIKRNRADEMRQKWGYF